MKNYLQRRDLGSLIDEAFDNFFQPAIFDKFSCAGMKTDIQEFEDRFELAVEVPGFNKEDITLDIKNGYLNIAANKQEKEESEDKKESRYLRRERSYSCNRSYYVGEVEKETVKAKYDNGILTVVVPKQKEKLEKNSRILIE
jgi:HSP20 family protein